MILLGIHQVMDQPTESLRFQQLIVKMNSIILNKINLIGVMKTWIYYI